MQFYWYFCDLIHVINYEWSTSETKSYSKNSIAKR